MYSLVVEDDFVSRKLLHKILLEHGQCDTAVDGKEAFEAYQLALKEGHPYDLICLDIMMPKMNGREVLEKIRKEENERGIGGLAGVKIIMTTALSDGENIMGAFREGAEAYLTKPIDLTKLRQTLEELDLIKG